MGPVITPESRARIESLIGQAVRDGASAVVDGRNPENRRVREGNFVRPTVIEDLPCRARSPRTEIFGPVLSLHHVDDIDDAIALVNSGRYGNQASLFTSSGASARKFRYEAEVGNVGINVGVAAPMAFFPVQRRARELLRRPPRPGPRRVRVLHPGEGRRRAVAEGVVAQVLTPGPIWGVRSAMRGARCAGARSLETSPVQCKGRPRVTVDALLFAAGTGYLEPAGLPFVLGASSALRSPSAYWIPATRCSSIGLIA